MMFQFLRTLVFATLVCSISFSARADGTVKPLFDVVSNGVNACHVRDLGDFKLGAARVGSLQNAKSTLPPIGRLAKRTDPTGSLESEGEVRTQLRSNEELSHGEMPWEEISKTAGDGGITTGTTVKPDPEINEDNLDPVVENVESDDEPLDGESSTPPEQTADAEADAEQEDDSPSREGGNVANLQIEPVRPLVGRSDEKPEAPETEIPSSETTETDGETDVETSDEGTETPEDTANISDDDAAADTGEGAATASDDESDPASEDTKASATEDSTTTGAVEGGTAPAEESTTTAPEEGTETTPVQEAAEEKPKEPEGPIDPVVIEVVKSLKKAGNGKETLALREYYDQVDSLPNWVSENGLNDAAKSIISEIEKADDYGLRASAFTLPAQTEATPAIEERAKAELKLARAILAYARHAKGGRVDAKKLGSQLEKNPKLLDPKSVLFAITSADDPAAYLRSLHPKHTQFVKLRKKLMELRYGEDDSKGPKIPAGPMLKRGVKHEQVALLRDRLGVTAGSGDFNEFDEAVERAVMRFQRENGLGADGVVGNGTRKILNGAKGDSTQINKILLNMERWRWLPENLNGSARMHIWSNVPEFWVRIFKEGDEKPVFSERTIVGLTTHKTPIFSDEMEWVEIHPTWYVPNSIKVSDILPSLKRPTSTVMKRYNLRLSCAGHGSDPKNIDWDTVDITKCRITQPPGPKSVLGDFKFKFPNKHSVYMHDTHKPGLFAQTKRAFSHGCMRIKNPAEMARVLLEHQSVMSSGKLDKILKGPTKLHTAKLPNHVPVHITYFTMLFNDDGKLVSVPDIYGHDSRLAKVLGTGASAAPAPVALTTKPAAPPKKKKKIKKKKKTASQEPDWLEQLFLPN